jgi:hypothetical protein
MKSNQHDDVVGDNRSPALRPQETALREGVDQADHLLAESCSAWRVQSNAAALASGANQASECRPPVSCQTRPWLSFFFDGTGNNMDADSKSPPLIPKEAVLCTGSDQAWSRFWMTRSESVLSDPQTAGGTWIAEEPWLAGRRSALAVGYAGGHSARGLRRDDMTAKEAMMKQMNSFCGKKTF